MEKKLHFLQLDALRFFSFFLVFLQHIKHYVNKKITFFQDSPINSFFTQLPDTGDIGVHIFFVISGFLITFLLIKEEDLNGKINVPYFYLRRVLRIWPLYYLIMLLGMFVLHYTADEFHFNGNYLLNLLFLNNWDVYYQAPNICIAWSVAIEEQFYLFWPLVFLLFKNKKALLIASFVLFSLSIGFTIYNASLAKYHTLGNLNFLMMGCIGGVIYSKYEDTIKKARVFKSSNLTIAVIIGTLLVLGSEFSPSMRFGFLIYYPSLILLPMIYLYLTINLVIRTKKPRFGFISTLGKYTYGMYLYHPIIIIFTKIGFDAINLNYVNNLYLHLLLAVISLTGTILISYLSYEYFEKHILKIKNKFSYVKTRI